MTFRLILLISGCAAALLAEPGGLSKNLEGLAPGKTVPVMVHYRNRRSNWSDLHRLAARRMASAAWGDFRCVEYGLILPEAPPSLMAGAPNGAARVSKRFPDTVAALIGAARVSKRFPDTLANS